MNKTAEKKVYVIIGGYGAGKTEISLNMAINSAREGKKTLLIDLDIVNPFFRSAFHKDLMDKEGIRLVSSEYTLEACDVPVVSPEVLVAFDSDYETVIFDVGGDPVGATALGQYFHKFKALGNSLEVLFLINTRRPLTSDVEDIVSTVLSIEQSARLKTTALVNNTNLASESSIELLKEGEEILAEAAKQLDIPIGYYGIKRNIYENNKDKISDFAGKPILLDIYTRLDWLDLPEMKGE